LVERTNAARYTLGPFDSYVAFGSFASLGSAGKLINSTLADNQEIVDRVAASKDERGDALRGATIEKTFQQPTGYEAYAPNARSKAEIRDTYSVKVVIRHDDKMKNGYQILTSFPFNP
jgi:hypothetical protein